MHVAMHVESDKQADGNKSALDCKESPLPLTPKRHFYLKLSDDVQDEGIFYRYFKRETFAEFTECEEQVKLKEGLNAAWYFIQNAAHN